MKKHQLTILQREIKLKIQDEACWLFPSDDKTKVEGFMGTGGERKIMFIGERPLFWTHWENEGRQFFYKVLEEFNLQDSHLTYLIKSCSEEGDPYPENLLDHWRLFNLEITLVEPKLVFAFGKRVFDFIYFPLLAEKKINIIQIDHYVNAYRFKKEIKFRKTIQNALCETQG